MTDILQHIDVHVRCVRCDETYDVCAANIAESHRMLAEGCPATPHECLPSFLATLVDEEALRAVQRAWRELEHAAHLPSRGAVLRETLAVERPFTTAPHRSVAFELDRWEDDGGAVTH